MINKKMACKLPSTDSDALDVFIMELQKTAKREFWPFFNCARYATGDVLKLSNECLTIHASVFNVETGRVVALYMNARSAALSWQQLSEADSLCAIRSWVFQYSR